MSQPTTIEQPRFDWMDLESQYSWKEGWGSDKVKTAFVVVFPTGKAMIFSAKWSDSDKAKMKKK